MDYARAAEAWLGGAVERNFQVWGDTFDPYLLSRMGHRRPDKRSGLTLQACLMCLVENVFFRFVLDFIRFTALIRCRKLKNQRGQSKCKKQSARQ